MQHNFDTIVRDGLQNQTATPCYIVSESLLKKNLELLRRVSDASGCKILLAQKAFSMYSFYPLIGAYLDGVTASGLYEARLGYEELCAGAVTDITGVQKRCENHVFSPAYPEAHMEELLQICDHIVFNSFAQWRKYRDRALAAGKECGIRINPECSTQEHAIYDPCAPGSRLGVTAADFEEDALEGISGLHFHCLCEQDADALEQTVEAVERRFGKYLYKMKWLNFGGGHHITREGYDVDRLIRLIRRIREKYDLTVYLEPGEAVALNAGFLVTEVLELVQNGTVTNVILDTSAACHMPDVLEMPYRPPLYGSGEAGEKPYTYRLGGPTCLAGDIIGDYSFDHELKPGERLVFGDMAIYSMVKNNTFNGMPLPDIAALDESGALKTVKHFGYEDFKGRL
ncbi:MAG: carboxynorspermidine decarboxylase [Lachnospiraceae bacterium]|nr:carboxynorspermidine decarboxylase [Lachnospiraceae bacterium]